jgi:TonB family protein
MRSPLRVAVIGFAQSSSNSRDLEQSIALALADALAEHGNLKLIKESMLRPALKGVGYDGSINMSKDEARRIAAAVGCDFFITGKTEILARSERKDETHIEAYAGVLIVDGRSGALAAFDFALAKGREREEASSGLVKELKSRATVYAEKMQGYRAAQTEAVAERADREAVIDLPDAELAFGAGFKPPEFLSRARPEYTGEAELADISATVEAQVVFSATGEIGRIELTRWAGFGLDESAARAIKELKFKPATRDGMAISVRALVRYNFRRVN